MSKVNEQEVVTLLAAKKGLSYLTMNDFTLLADKAKRVKFKKGEVLVQRGKKADGIYLLLKGAAKVHLSSAAGAPTIGPGEICGEMSFLEDIPASALVVADGDVEAYRLDRLTLQTLFELFPHLGSRFYRSLATNLSHRLRDLIEAGPGGR
jgi:extracellular factor (EF) 3-hydroxypalmitic acid methyl ester biosynthesis protein